MPETQPLTVDFIQADDVLQVLPYLPLRTSDSLGWNGIYVQQHHQPAWETPEYAHIRHMLIVHSPDVTTQSERWFDGRRHREQVGGDNTIIIVPAGVQHRANWNRESPFSLLFLEPDRLIQIARELVTTEYIQLLPHGAMQDPLIDQIGRALTAELGSNQIGSQLFVESLTIALAVHLLRHYSDHPQPLRDRVGGLPQRKLDQAIEYIHEHLGEDLSIAAIANALEMSQYYSVCDATAHSTSRVLIKDDATFNRCDRTASWLFQSRSIHDSISQVYRYNAKSLSQTVVIQRSCT
jgi:AraC family transcriptional regulator